MLAWQERWPRIGDVRGLGSMLAIELVSRCRDAPHRPRSSPRPWWRRALQRGLLLLTCGVYGNCIRSLVPLVITDAELEEALGGLGGGARGGARLSARRARLPPGEP